jgi:probable rRNA maturation factor
VIILEKATRGVKQADLGRFAARAQKLAGIPGAVDVLIADNRRLRALNRRFRGKNVPTDVLSFPHAEGGDIAISAEIALENAGRYRHSPAAELKILILHGMLHLAGHDHEHDDGQMARIETRLRAQLNLPSSLISRAHHPDRGVRREQRPAAKKQPHNGRAR